MAQYYKIAKVCDTADAEMFDISEQNMLTIDMDSVYDNVQIAGTREVTICTQVVGEGMLFDVQANVGQDGALYMLCSEAEEYVL